MNLLIILNGYHVVIKSKDDGIRQLQYNLSYSLTMSFLASIFDSQVPQLLNEDNSSTSKSYNID